MPIKPNVRTGNVDWTGENPGMLLKTDPAGDWSVLMLFFRIVWSPVGPGNILLLYENPNKNVGMPECCNVIMADNEALRDYIKTGFIEKLGTFGDVPAYSASSQLKIDKVVTEGDPCGDFYSETVIGDGLSIKLVWEELGKPDLVAEAVKRKMQILSDFHPQHIPADLDAHLRATYDIRLA